MSDNLAVVKEGYLHKKGQHIKMWKIRYFVLTKHELSYSKKSGKHLKASFPLGNIELSHDQNKITHPGNYVFQLQLTPKKSIYVSAATESERMDWIHEVQKLQERHWKVDSNADIRKDKKFALRSHSSTLSSRTDSKRMMLRKGASRSRKRERKRCKLPKLNKSFSEIWVEDILHTTHIKENIVEGLCFAGVPRELRGRVWCWLLGNKLQINENLFCICKERAEAVRQEITLKKLLGEKTRNVISTSTALTDLRTTNCFQNSSSDEIGEALTKSWIERNDSETQDLQSPRILQDLLGIAERLVTPCERSIWLVEVDIRRTFANHPSMQDGGDVVERTRDVLYAYICYRPDLGYVQGMSYLAAALCLHMDAFAAFKALAALMSTSLLFDMFRLEEKRTFHYLKVFDRILQHELPDIRFYFEENGIDVQMYAVDWTLTLFTRCLPLNAAFRLWDCYLYLGSPFFFQAGVALLKVYEHTIRTLDAAAIMRFLHKFPFNTKITDIFDAMDTLKLSREDILIILSSFEGEDTSIQRQWSPGSYREHQVTFPEAYD